MNAHLDTLCNAVYQQGGVERDALIKAFFMLRAPYSLAGIVVVCRRLVELLDAYPELKQAPAFDDQAARLKVLRHVAELRGMPGHFLGETVLRNGSTTPLRPHTGDSGLCEVLLFEPRGTVSDAHRQAFEALQVWFVWQTFHHQKRRSNEDAYTQYITGDGSKSLKHGWGARIYTAMRVIRDLGDSHQERLARHFADLLAIGQAESEAVARLLRALRRGRGVAELAARDDLASATYQRYCRLFAGDDGTQRIPTWRPEWDGIRVFLTLIWLQPGLPRDRRRQLDSERRHGFRSDVVHYRGLTSVGHNLDEQHSLGGTVVDVHWPAPRTRRPDIPADGVHDPEDEPPLEPLVTFFLGDGDVVGDWYKAKSAQHHIERVNAGLPWAKWRLSATAIRAVLAKVRCILGEYPARRRARLTLGLSLLTGRPFFDVSAVHISDTQVLPDRINITLTDYVLHVPAGTPKLKRQSGVSNHPLPAYCGPHTRMLRLALPDAWRPLIDSLRGRTERRSSAIARRARQLVRRLPTELAITPHGVVSALRLALLQTGQGDLGWVKVVTDATDANMNNLIHYASYPQARVEQVWHDVVASWGLILPPYSIHTTDPAHVGSPASMDATKLAQHIATLKNRFRQTVAAERWDAVYNQLTVYVAVWLGLATAGRSTLHPVPEVVTTRGWALIRDKSRPDGSTDRYVPLTPAVREQIHVLKGLTQALALVHPVLQQAVAGPRLRLFMFKKDGKVVPYQPLYLDRTVILRDLPGNWGRKFVRSRVGALSGRFMDAALGHWVRGRHPWTWTATFPGPVFRDEWLACQAAWEQTLGFEVLSVDGLPAAHSAVYGYPDSRQATTSKPASKAVCVSMETADNLLREASRKGAYEQVMEDKLPVPGLALQLAQQALAQAMDTRLGTSRGQLKALNTDDREWVVASAEAIATRIRKTTKLPLFASRPRARFQHDWLVNRDDFATLAYVEQQLWPTIERDLTHIPARESGKRERQVDLGRLIVASVVLGGVPNTAHLDAWLTFVGGRESVVAVGEARIVALDVRSRRSREMVRRTLLLPPYLATLVAVEREALRPVLTGLLTQSRSHRHLRWNGVFRQYLRYLGLPTEISLSRFMYAMRQYMLLESTPLLAAYASGELLTHDLPVSEFQRLAGFQSGAAQARSDDSVDEPDDMRMPADIKTSSKNLVRQLAPTGSPHVGEWLRRSELARKKWQRTNEVLLCRFSEYMVTRYRPKRTGRLSQKMRRIMVDYLTIVWAGLVGLSDLPENRCVIDEAMLDTLAEQTEAFFSARKHHGAWSRFRSFLLDKRVDHAGFEVDRILSSTPRHVSAKLLSASEQERVATLLRSVQSDIDVPSVRQVAQRHYQLTRAAGARRAETEKLRWCDVDGDMLRIRSYTGRRLKTGASERVIPAGLVDDGQQLTQPEQSATARVIGMDGQRPVTGDNFFHQVSTTMKKAADDRDIGPHHLRHSLASLMTLRMLDDAVDLSLLDSIFPWLSGSLPSPQDKHILLDNEPQAGQGLKAVAALLGHLHETTTLKHYVHTLCLALHAYLLKQDDVALHVAFAKRAMSRASLFRRYNAYHKEYGDEHEINRRLRDDIEGWAAKLQDAVPLVRSERRQTPAVEQTVTSDDDGKSAEIRLRQLELIQNYLATGQGEPPDNEAAWRAAIQQLATIPSGRVGTHRPRHPLPVEGTGGLFLPAMLSVKTATANALTLLVWLLALQAQAPTDYDWLMNKWLYASEKTKGYMRLDDDTEKQRAEAIDTPAGIHLQVDEVPVSRARKARNRKATTRYRFRIRLGEKAGTRYQGNRREAAAVRWVMTWLAVGSQLL